MEYRRIGNSDLKASVIGLGSVGSGLVNKEEREELEKKFVKVVRHALDLGINLIDTAEGYWDGRSEKVIGEAIKDRQQDALIATKVEPEHLRFDDVLKAAEGSLRRLRVSTIDLYQIHTPNPSIPIKETMKAMERLVKEGKIRHIGVSNFNVSQLREAQKVLSRAEIVSNQVKYNLLQREIEDEIFPYCRREKISIIAHTPLFHGLLAGRYNQEEARKVLWRASNLSSLAESDKDKKKSNLIDEDLAKGMKMVEVLREIGATRGKKPAQIALNWLVIKRRVFAIPGACTLKEVEENCEVVGLKLSTDDLRQIEKTSAECGRLVEVGM